MARRFEPMRGFTIFYFKFKAILFFDIPAAKLRLAATQLAVLLHICVTISDLPMETALITGATGGIGSEFARLFAQNGIHPILTGRNEIRLRELADQLSGYGVGVTCYVKDLSRMEEVHALYGLLKEANQSPAYLVNNAGFGTSGPFSETDPDRELEMYRLNMLAPALLTRLFAADMKERGFGRILNVASTAAFQPLPGMAGYAATKAFLLTLSQAVHHELRGSNVSVSVLCPGVTDTSFHAVAGTQKSLMSNRFTHATAREVAQYGYRLMMRRKSLGIHGFFNKLLIFSERFICRRGLIALTDKMLRG